MKTKQPYSYTILRYVHDVTTGEFVNVGVVLHMQPEGFLRVKARHTIGRIRDIFPDLDKLAFTAAMKAVESRVKSISKEIASAGLLQTDSDAGTLARRALPTDYSSLQWSPVGTGITDNCEKTFERLYERFVSRYDSHLPHRRSDEDVWRPVQERLSARLGQFALEKKEIIGKEDVILFDRAWKNGIWHAYEPLSLDLADADGIKDKVRRWRGHLDCFANEPSELFKVSFVLGKPQNETLLPAYAQAKSILENAHGHPAIFEEPQIENLIAAIEEEYRVHQANKM